MSSGKGPTGPFLLAANKIIGPRTTVAQIVSNRTEQLAELLAPTVAALQLELLGVEFAPSSGRSLLRLYIDVGADAGPGRAVTLDDCEAVSREVSAVLDVEDPVAGQYTLEVSSPGIDRPLFTPAQFARHIGETAKLTLRLPQDGRRRVQGRIAAIEAAVISVVVDEGATGEATLAVAHDNIEKARLVPDLAALGLAPEPKNKPGRAGKQSKTPRGGNGPVTEHQS